MTSAPESASPPALTAGEAVRAVARDLAAHGLDEAPVVAAWLVAHRLGCSRTDLALRASAVLPAADLRALRAACRRLARHEPLAYVLGDAEFRGRVFRADARALIPRPETEELADLVLRDPSLRRPGGADVADVGTGSGCLAVTLALDSPAARVVAVDSDADALALARENARIHGVADRIRWRLGDLLGGFAAASLDLIVANLPYVPTAEWARLERCVRDFEPRRALDGGPDGLDAIRALAAQAPAVLRRPGAVWLEIGEDQGERVRRLLEAAGAARVSVARDLAGRDRFVSADWR